MIATSRLCAPISRACPSHAFSRLLTPSHALALAFSRLLTPSLSPWPSPPQVQGDNPFFGNWSVTRHIGDPRPDAATGAPTYYSTADIYSQRPDEWWTGGGPDHGIAWLQMVRASERALGDELYSPFLSAGWSQQVERNVRPAQWLGVLKVMAAWGAEWFYTGFFSLRAPFPASENWCWQALAPVYAQAAVVSAAADYVYKGSLVLNGPNSSYAGAWGGQRDDGTKGSPLLWAGAPHVLAIARELDGSFLITATLQRLSNNARNLASSKARSCDVHVPGLTDASGEVKPLRVSIRPQGSVYIYTPASHAAGGKPTLTQLDAWHLPSHFSRWPSSTARYEAEMFEGHQTRPGKAMVATELPESAVHELDFSTFTTFVDLARAANASREDGDTRDAPRCLNIHPAVPGTSPSTSDAQRRVKVLARGGTVRVNGGRAASAGMAGGWVWLERRDWVVERAEVAQVKVCLSGDAHVDAIEVEG